MLGQLSPLNDTAEAEYSRTPEDGSSIVNYGDRWTDRS